MSKGIFKMHKGLDKYFETADGNCFYTEHNAKTHARKLEDKNVKKVRRASQVDTTSQDDKKAKKLNAMQAAKLRADIIAAVETSEEVKELLKDETAKSVIKAGEARLEVLNQTETNDKNQ